MLPAQYDITHYRGDYFKIRVKFTNVDLTAETILAQCRTGLELNSQLVFTFSTTATLVDSVDTAVDLELAPVVTASMKAGIYYYDLQIGEYTRLAGTFELLADVSRGS